MHVGQNSHTSFRCDVFNQQIILVVLILCNQERERRKNAACKSRYIFSVKFTCILELQLFYGKATEPVMDPTVLLFQNEEKELPKWQVSTHFFPLLSSSSPSAGMWPTPGDRRIQGVRIREAFWRAGDCWWWDPECWPCCQSSGIRSLHRYENPVF